MTVLRPYGGLLHGGPPNLIVAYIINPLLMLISFEEGYVLPTVDIFKALFSAHPIPFVCTFSFAPYRI